MKLGMFTLRSEAVWVPPPNRPLFSTAQAERPAFAALATDAPLSPPAAGRKPTRMPVIEDEATAS